MSTVLDERSEARRYEYEGTLGHQWLYGPVGRSVVYEYTIGKTRSPHGMEGTARRTNHDLVGERMRDSELWEPTFGPSLPQCSAVGPGTIGGGWGGGGSGGSGGVGEQGMLLNAHQQCIEPPPSCSPCREVRLPSFLERPTSGGRLLLPCPPICSLAMRKV